MSRKTLIIIISALFILLLGIGVYLYFKRPATFLGIGIFPGEGPSGEVVDIVGGGEETNIIVPITGEVAPPARLYELHKSPVAGVAFFEMGIPVITPATKKTVKKAPLIPHTVSARYIERGLGHIFETSLEALRAQLSSQSSPSAETRISNETHSRLIEALWGNNGGSVVIRSLDTSPEDIIKTRIINLSAPFLSFKQGTSTENTSESTFLSAEEVFLLDNIPFMAMAEDGKDSLFYLENGESYSAGAITNFKNAGATRIFTSSFTEWLPQFPNQNLITLSTRPSGEIPGYLFFLNPKTKTLTKILDGISGLTTKTSPDGKYVLYSTSKNNSFDLSVYNIAKNETLPLLVKTLPEKCVWSKKETSVVYCAVPQIFTPTLYPDRWYQGLVSFSDSVWKIDTTSARAEIIFSPEELDAPSLDIINPTLPSDDSYLLFMNKVTGTPWVYFLTGAAPPPVATTAAPFTKTLITSTSTKR